MYLSYYVHLVRINVTCPSTFLLIVTYHLYFQNICRKEGLSLPNELAERIAVQSNGNLRRAILFLETCKVQQYVYTDFI